MGAKHLEKGGEMSMMRMVLEAYRLYHLVNKVEQALPMLLSGSLQLLCCDVKHVGKHGALRFRSTTNPNN